MTARAFDRAAAVRGATHALATYSRARSALIRTRSGTTQRTRDASSRLFAALSVLQANIPAGLRSTDTVGDNPPAPGSSASPLASNVGSRIEAWVDAAGEAGMVRLRSAVDAVNRVCESLLSLYGRFWANNPLGRTLIDMYDAVRASAREALDALRRVGPAFGFGAGAVVAGVAILWLWSKGKRG